MSLHLSSHDLTRLGAATEALLAPAHGDPWAWWRGVETRVRELFPGSNVMLSMPEGDRLRNDSESIDDSARRRISELTAVDLSAGHFLIRDPAVEAWVAYRRQHRVEVWNTARNLRIIAEMGYDGDRSVFINEGLYAASMHGLCGLSYESPLGEAFLQVGYPRGRASRFADDSQLLALLLPAYRAGHHAAFGYARRESALAATLDAAGEALLVVAPDGRTLHRSAALVRLLSADPERDAVLRELDAAALALRAHAAARRGPLADGRPATRPRRRARRHDRGGALHRAGVVRLGAGVGDARHGAGGRRRRARAPRAGRAPRDARPHAPRGRGGAPARRAAEQRRGGRGARRQRAHGAAPHGAGDAQAGRRHAGRGGRAAAGGRVGPPATCDLRPAICDLRPRSYLAPAVGRMMRVRSAGIARSRRLTTRRVGAWRCPTATGPSHGVLVSYQTSVSRAEPRAYSKSRTRSAPELRLYPSAMFAAVEPSARCNWSAIGRQAGRRARVRTSLHPAWIA
jgi:PAS domain-containing protein